MGYTIRPAQRGEAKPLIGFYAESGKGKTLSALVLARGFAGPRGRIAMIETEGGRGEAYVGYKDVSLGIDIGTYDVISMRGEFAPAAYGEAISAAEKAKPDALIIDSASHEWEGTGGVLDMAAKNQAEAKKGPLIWQRPKMDHQRHFMLRFTQSPIPLVILCMRAKYPMEQVPKDPRNPQGEKEWVRSKSLEPKQADDILFEMFIHGWFDDEHRFRGTRWSLPELRQVVVDNQVISHATGARLAAWTKGETVDRPAQVKTDLQQTEVSPVTVPAPGDVYTGPSLYRYINSQGGTVPFATLEDMLHKVGGVVDRQKDPEAVKVMLDNNRPVLAGLLNANQIDAASALRQIFDDKVKSLGRRK